eukprot:gene4753-5813_t
MAMAVQRLFKDAKCTIGPWIEKGFYYDFDYSEAFSDKDLKRIKKEMIKIINKKYELRREEVTREEARARIEAVNEPYKLELLDAIKEDPITIYHIGDEWWDLCAGPHVEDTGKLNGRAIELESVAGAYWRGDENKAMLQRIYGTAWESQEQLAAYKEQKLEAARRDHRKIGADLNLFSIQESVGGGLVFWHPKGAMGVLSSAGLSLMLTAALYSPHVAKLDLWKTSGHFDFYAENMFDQMQIEDENYQLKPMNCPFHIAVYKVDFNLPERFQLEYKTSENDMAQPIMIHRAIFGSIERFFGILTENYAGDFPLWLAPVQIEILPISAKFEDYAQDVADKMKAKGIRAQASLLRVCVQWAELGTVYRYERSGTMHGLFRVRGFTQDDAHIFCLPPQLTDEILGVLNLTEEILSTYGFTDYEINLSTRPEKSVGDDSIWEASEASLKEALERKGWAYEVDVGGGAFYGPKIDLKIKDAIGRKWQCSTIQ